MKTYITNRDRGRGGRCVAQAPVAPKRGEGGSTPASSRSVSLPGPWLTLRATVYSYFNDCNDCNNFIVFFFFSPTPTLVTRHASTVTPRNSLILAYSRLFSPNGRQISEPPRFPRRAGASRESGWTLVRPEKFPQIVRFSSGGDSLSPASETGNTPKPLITNARLQQFTMVSIVSIAFLFFPSSRLPVTRHAPSFNPSTFTTFYVASTLQRL